ncbi:hypothetical protein AAFF_G00192290 [Aldrovandia affinis]|uniref:Annexin n=1 Tax=Aldrovandia affinis TaxID=143900 RepID=A0AAD7RIW8_9TELE|nr:hypothetical protein AAFF_G00192290 [Aldrovandia affinis]
MPSPRRFLDGSTSLPLSAGWGLNLCIYLGLFSTLFLLMVLLLWQLIRQLGNSVGNSAVQPRRSIREPPGLIREHVLRLEAQHLFVLAAFALLHNIHTNMASRGSVQPFVHFNAKQDVELLHKAMKGLGTDEEAILRLLVSRSNSQRQKIKAAYKSRHGKDLVSALQSEIGGKFEKLIVALMTPPVAYDAGELRNAIKGAGTEENVLIEILASRTQDEVKEIIKAYKKQYRKSLESDVSSDTTGHFKRMLVILLQASREKGVNEGGIEKDAKELFAAGEQKCGTDEDKFISILGNRSTEHLMKVFEAYKKLSGYEIEESIERETSGSLQELLLAVVKCTRSVPAYFAECLYHSMRRAGTDDDTLIRVMVSRSEVDMLDIKAEFKRMYSQSLYTTIQEDTSGDYMTALLYLTGGNDG